MKPLAYNCVRGFDAFVTMLQAAQLSTTVAGFGTSATRLPAAFVVVTLVNLTVTFAAALTGALAFACQHHVVSLSIPTF